MKLVFVTAEADPFLKTGGLGDAVSSLTTLLAQQGVDVRVIMPKYSAFTEQYKKAFVHLAHFDVPVAWRKQYCGLDAVVYNGVHYYFIDNEYYFARPGIYGEDDDAERFAFFSRAALESLIHIPGFKPDIIHCHDWHTAIIPLMLKTFYNREPLYYPIKTIFTIHNLNYQGIFPKVVLSDVLGLGTDYFTEDTLEYYGAVNFMKGALVYADRITTVDPTYLESEQNWNGLLNKRSNPLTVILNDRSANAYLKLYESLL